MSYLSTTMSTNRCRAALRSRDVKRVNRVADGTPENKLAIGDIVRWHAAAGKAMFCLSCPCCGKAIYLPEDAVTLSKATGAVSTAASVKCCTCQSEYGIRSNRIVWYDQLF